MELAICLKSMMFWILAVPGKVANIRHRKGLDGIIVFFNF